MPLHTLTAAADGGRPTYEIKGDFEKLMFFCPDIRSNQKDKSNKDEFIDKSPEELSTELRKYLKSLSDLGFTWLENKLISDYWLVITPLACDNIQRFMPEFKQPLKKNNYIVTAFYNDDVDLVDMIFQKVPGVFGTMEQHSDPKRRLATEAQLSVYMACEINDESEYFEEIANLDKGSDDYKSKFGLSLLSAELDLGCAASEYIKDPIRTFLQYGTDQFGVRFVEQYFNHKASKKVNGYSFGDGYIKNRMAKVNLDKNEKYAAFHDLFGSTGTQFAEYALSKEDLRQKLIEFEDNPWIKLPAA